MKSKKYIRPETFSVYVQESPIMEISNQPNAGDPGSDSGKKSSGDDGSDERAKRNPFGWSEVGFQSDFSSSNSIWGD